MMFTRFLSIMIVCCLITSVAHTQLSVVWEKTYDHPGTIHAVQVTETGEFIFVGENRIVKTDVLGNPTLAIVPTDDNLYTIHKTTDNHYIIGGSLWDPYGTLDMFYARYSDNLVSQWEKSYRYYDEGGMEKIYHGIQTTDGGHAFCGYSSYFFDVTTHEDHGEILKTDAFGTIQWDRSVGISGGYGDVARCVQQVTSGNIYVAGTDEENLKGWLFRFTSSGNFLGTEPYNYSSASLDRLYHFQQTDANDLIFTGLSKSTSWSAPSDVWLFKTDASGIHIWGRLFGGPDDDEGHCVRQTTDGNYLIAGKTESYGAGGSDAWLIKTDIHGNKLWDLTFGGSGDDEIRKIVEPGPGEYIACGTKNGKGWLLKLGSISEFHPPALVEPVAAKTGIGVDLWLNWAESSSADFYDVQVDNTANFSSPVFTRNDIDGLRCYIPPLSYYGRYHWRVRARKNGTTTDWSDPRSFTTMGPPPVTINAPDGYVLTYLEVGDQYYIDRPYIVHSVPDDLRNFLWIKTANDDKNVTAPDHLSFDLNNEATVYVGYDHRAAALPDWLADGFTDTGKTIQVSDELEYLNVYHKKCSAGTVTLGGNKTGGENGAKSNYVVFLDILPSLFTKVSTGLPAVQKGTAIWGDYDSDGDLDIFLAGQNTSNDRIAHLYKNDGTGGFQQVAGAFTGVRAAAAEFGDYDNDGDLDILYCGQAAGNIAATRLYRNDGSDNFTAIAPGLEDVYSGEVAWGDMDNDGDLDILLLGTNPNPGIKTRLYKNQGNDTFEEYDAGLQDLKAGTADWLDYDLDGDKDILLTGEDDSALPHSMLYRNEGDGTFTHAHTFENILLGCTAIGDYDNDGDPDIFLSGYTVPGQNCRLYRNDGGGVFTDVAPALPSIVLGSADWGDYDNDGDLDLVLTGMDTGGDRISRIYTNTGGANFTRLMAGLPGVFTGHARWGDFDNDDDLDILLCGFDTGDNNVTDVYRNHTQVKNNIPMPPSNLMVTPSNNDTSFTLSWTAAADDETPPPGLTYNVRIGTQTGGTDVMAPMTLLGNGYRKIVKTGNAGHNTSWTIKGMPEGEYFWSVQSVDHARAGSRFAGEVSFIYIPVPVELAAFTAVQQANAVTISWCTATETVNRGFNLYRSTQKNEKYTKINKSIIPGAGTTSSEKRYCFSDRDISPNTTLYYKLEQIDLDGKTTSYGPYQVRVGRFFLPDKYALLHNYPNPFNPETWITWQMPEKTDVKIAVYNIRGEWIKDLYHHHENAGIYKTKWNGCFENGQKCPSGVYLIRLQAGHFSDVKKMVLVR